MSLARESVTSVFTVCRILVYAVTTRDNVEILQPVSNVGGGFEIPML
jgi:hypothetical protein